ncbi:reverse transcriptase zinc-binding domain-containing protein [Tanacetum coccineum]
MGYYLQIKRQELLGSWTGIGALCDSVSYRDLYDARFKATMTVKAFVDVYNGLWPEMRRTKFPLIYQLPAIVLNQDNIDVLMWKSNDGTLSKFFVRQAYYDLHNTSEVVPWSKLVWFSQNIPKYAFILWLAIKGTLTTQDKVKRWGSFDMMAYPLCYEDMDSHEHLKEITESSGMRKEALTALCCENMGQSSFLYVIRKAACLGGVPTSDALTAGLEMHS